LNLDVRACDYCIGVQSQREQIFGQLLALRCRRGEREAWRELIAAWEPRLFYYIRRLVPQESDAWDVLQQTWLGAFENIRSLGDTRLLATWLYCIARNKAISHRRSRGARAAELTEIIGDPAAEDEPDTLEEFENAEAVHRAIDELSLAHREALTLHFLQDLSLEQIADVLDVPVGTVKSRLHHAKRELKKVLEREVSRHD
jgi:RNA polymerase sigma-70 factor, ECF subfamily